MTEKTSRFQFITDYRDWTVRTMVRKPELHCAANWSAIILMTLIVFAAGLFEVAELQFFDFLIATEADVQNFFAFDQAQTDNEKGLGSELNISFRDTPIFDFSVLAIYEVQEGALFTPENVQFICQIEDVFLKEELYPFFCPTDFANGAETDCREQRNSVSFHFYGKDTGNCDLLLQETIDERLEILKSDEEVVAFLLNNRDDPTVARTQLALGSPLGADSPPGVDFVFATDDILSQEATDGHTLLLEDFSSSLTSSLGQSFSDGVFTSKNATIQARVSGPLLEAIELQNALETDQIIVMASFLFVAISIFLYTRSFFLANIALFSISMSLFAGIFVYAAILQVDYFTSMHVVSFFIIVAIGANNFYVIVDAWKQSEEIVRQELREKYLNLPADKRDSYHKIDTDDLDNEEFSIARLKYAYSRAAMSVFNTSMTTFIAFIANLLSPIAPIAGFGLFSAMAIFVNFVYMLNVHPTHVMIYHKYIFLPKYRRNKKASKDDLIISKKSSAVEELDKEEVEAGIQVPKKMSSVKVSINQPPKMAGPEPILSVQDRARNYYIYLMTETLFPIISLIGMLILAVILLIFATQLEPPSSVESFFQDSHMFTGFSDDFNNLFAEGSDDTFTLVSAVYGIKDLDSSGVVFLTSDTFRGDPVFDDNFDFSLEDTQQEIIDYCEFIKTVPCGDDACTLETLIIPETVVCSTRIFQEFFPDQETFVTRSDGTSTGLTQQELLDLVLTFLSSPNGTIHVENFGVGEEKIEFVATNFRQSMKVNQPLATKEPVLELFAELTEEVIADASEGLDTFFHTSFDIIFQHTERGLVEGLFSGMIVSLGISFLIILGGTRNLLISIYAISGVSFIVVSVLGSIQTLGFELGTVEAIAGVMVIGLAVDYIVHLGYMFVYARGYLAGAEAYPEDKKSRVQTFIQMQIFREVKNKDMVKFAIEKMMFTIIAGGLTTMSAGILLFFCSLTLFTKMATMIMLTATYSLLFAFFYFVPLLRLLGPGQKSLK